MITKRRIEPAFSADGIIVEKYDWACTLEDLPDMPTEGVSVNDLLLVVDAGESGEFYYFDGSEWKPVGAQQNSGG